MLKQLKTGLIIVVLGFLLLFFMSRGITERPDWSVDYNGILEYPQDRGKVDVSKVFMEEDESFTLEKVIYESREQDVYGLLFLPKDMEDVHAVIMLPGANGKKENHLKLGKKMAAAGYAFLTIDQRGIGETGGALLTMGEDYQAFFQNKEPMQHLMVYDVLKAFDVLRKEKTVDKEKIIVAGESMGARFALIAAALDTRIKGCLVFSTSGYGMHETASTQQKFMASINPDFYVGKIAPRKLVMFHAEHDSVVPFAQAEATFSFAKEPKEFILMEQPCDHGYCDTYYEEFLAKLEWLVE